MTNHNFKNDVWLDKVIVWADEHEISSEILPRDKAEILALTSLNLNKTKLKKLPDWIGELTLLETLEASDCELTELPIFISKLTKTMTKPC